MKQYTPDKKYKNFILDSVEHLRLSLNLHNWSVEVRFFDRIPNHPQVKHLYPGGATAETESEPVYLTISLSLSKKMEKKYREGKFREIREDLCHELVHRLLEDLSQFAYQRIGKKRGELQEFTQIDESTTQVIATILMKHIEFI